MYLNPAFWIIFIYFCDHKWMTWRCNEDHERQLKKIKSKEMFELLFDMVLFIFYI